MADMGFFTRVFIDEAGASTEPETLLGIKGIKSSNSENACRVILSGDHKQLGSIIKSKRAAKFGIDKAMMHRLLVKSECYQVDAQGNYNDSYQTRFCV